MDPDETLRQIRQIARDTVAGTISTDEAPDYLEELVDYAEGLDEWLTKGGFLPRAWTTGRSTTTAEGVSTVELIIAAAPQSQVTRPMDSPTAGLKNGCQQPLRRQALESGLADEY